MLFQVDKQTEGSRAIAYMTIIIVKFQSGLNPNHSNHISTKTIRMQYKPKLTNAESSDAFSDPIKQQIVCCVASQIDCSILKWCILETLDAVHQQQQIIQKPHTTIEICFKYKLLANFLTKYSFILSLKV